MAPDSRRWAIRTESCELCGVWIGPHAHMLDPDGEPGTLLTWMPPEMVPSGVTAEYQAMWDAFSPAKKARSRAQLEEPVGERVDVGPIYPEEWLHLHGKAISGLRHSHRLRPNEDRDEPDHDHEGDPATEWDDVDQRGEGAALYWR